MRKAIAATVLAVVFGIALAVRPAAADAAGKCNGQVVAGIAATWPWAHDDKSAFPPPPGAIALWIKEFGPLVGVSSVRELQILFCSTT